MEVHSAGAKTGSTPVALLFFLFPNCLTIDFILICLIAKSLLNMGSEVGKKVWFERFSAFTTSLMK